MIRRRGAFSAVTVPWAVLKSHRPVHALAVFFRRVATSNGVAGDCPERTEMEPATRRPVKSLIIVRLIIAGQFGTVVPSVRYDVLGIRQDSMVREDKTPAAVLLPEQHAVLERLLASPLIARAPRLRGFLAYVSQCMLDGRLDEVTEQQIGCRVFGRPEGYNHTEDNIVRVTARNLRAKLE